MAEISEYITTREASKRSGLSQAHVWTLVRRGTVTAHRLGHAWLVNVPSLEQYLANRPHPGLKPGQKIKRPSKQRPA